MPTSGDVVVTKVDVEGVPGDAVSIRLPGGEWSDSLTLENVEPGTYLVEVKDKDGNIRTVEVRVTKRDIVARSVRSAKDNITPAAIATIAGGAGISIGVNYGEPDEYFVFTWDATGASSAGVPAFVAGADEGVLDLGVTQSGQQRLGHSGDLEQRRTDGVVVAPGDDRSGHSCDTTERLGDLVGLLRG